jgi:hypothetical protein
MLDDKTYNIGKKLVQVILPAFSSLYFGLASIWGLPAAEQVVGTLAVLATFIGVVLGISTKHYEESGAAYDGQIVVSEVEGGSKVFSLELDGDPMELESKKDVTFKVASAEE